MTNTFMDLSTSSGGESRDYQSKRAKDGFPSVRPRGNSGPDEDRTDGPKWATDGSADREPNSDAYKTPSKAPQLKPSL